MKICKQIWLLTITLYLLASCADTHLPPPQTFNDFLYNQSSMTKQLLSLDNSLKVTLLFSGMDGSTFKRISSLSLKNKPVIIALSQARIGNPYFINLLQNANTTPIGKILFAGDSGVFRDPNMEVEQVYLDFISDHTVKTAIAGLGYTNRDIFYKRTSIFRKDKQSMQVVEYILPSIHYWIK